MLLLLAFGAVVLRTLLTDLVGDSASAVVGCTYPCLDVRLAFLHILFNLFFLGPGKVLKNS